MRPVTETMNGGGNYGKTGGAISIGLMSILLAFFMWLALPLDVMADRGWQKTQPSKRWQGQAQSFVLDFNDSRMRGHRGEPAVLFLKKELLRQYPGTDVTDLRLRKVVLVAKTRAGKGVAQLRVGPEVSGMHQVAGYPPDFHSRSKHSYGRTYIGNPFPPSWGPWQLHLRGHFKVRKVVLEVEQRHRPQYGWGRRDGGFHLKLPW